MTPKEKAKELVLKYYLLIPMNTISFAKQCALIAVDEILSLNAESFDELPNPHHYYSKKYWDEVKKEIEKI